MDNNLELEHVSFEQAVALKELGFPQSTFHVYDIRTKQITSDINYFATYGEDDYSISAPELELVAKWLRVEKNIHITPQYKTLGNKVIYYSKINAHCLEEKDSLKRIIFESWEQALSAGIDKAIKILTK